MIPKISLTAAFLLMVAPPLACASDRAAANSAPMTRQAHESPAGMLVAQDSEPSAGTLENGNDNDNENSAANDSADDNQNGDNNQADQENGEQQPVAPPVLNRPENDANDAPQFNQAPQPQPQPVNPYQ